MTFNLLDIILFVGVSQGIFLAITLRLIDNRNKAANDILSIAIGIAVVMLFGRVIAFRVEALWVVYVAEFVDVTIFIFGPLIYCYIRRLLFQETTPYRLSFWHYLIPIAHLTIISTTYFIIPMNIEAMQASSFLPYFWFFAELVGIASFIGYTLASYRLFNKHKEGMKHQVSFVLVIRRYITYVLGTISLFTILWLVSFASKIFKYSDLSTIINYQLIWISIPLFIYVIGYYSLRQPEIFRVPMRSKTKEERARLQPDEIQILQKRLQFYIHEEAIYKTPDLSLKSLAEKLNTSPNDLSWLLNQVYQKSFYDYINAHRVQDVLESIDHRELHLKQTLLAIAFDAGFNSKSTFNKAFKQLTSQTPSAYIKSKQVA